MIPTPYFVYILECADGTLYTGIATDIARRFTEHASGKGSKYVFARGAKRIIYSEQCPDKGTALKREIAIKRLPRNKKLELVRAHE
ncbi:MAG: hypothetical protein ACD_81C00196G0007 [uncultured bacterium]|uniref:GIY-YIG domain-containing protein n=2 Tax=Candidatus Wolfeibacteriota TaxID=1752735 RepID=A0A0G1K6Y3_9BACT|nr:MAG: hypothetical protein ACD_81C00196G0007 [uncultured bacterium]KKR12656.1 MAG: hypothetical protein UT41_C0001G0200 [Candidatus Wolfebacteria bacterium GW2011_GWC2_39_22]KKT43589.1 MAG: hypothetical protein UW32_C0001G0181 [Candidatus Wolfebacteria bacterium GW2011_GWE2_44_13]HBI25681.1 endonuclease [Candidatus Wolfebacteria bacterium]